jgi:hypothetical protein
MGRECSTLREMRSAYKILVGKPEGKRPRVGSRRVWDALRTDLIEASWEGVDWILLAVDRDQ